jgi:hypothetical protein
MLQSGRDDFQEQSCIQDHSVRQTLLTNPLRRVLPKRHKASLQAVCDAASPLPVHLPGSGLG